MSVTPTPPIDDFLLWADRFLQRGALIELAVLAACLLVAWTLVALLRRWLQPDQSVSIWFGRRLFDGVLFPLLWLLLAQVARGLLEAYQGVAIMHLAIPVLMALVVIRVGVKVLQVAFGDAAWLKPIERTISWLAWLCVVLWVSGLLPLVLAQLDEIHWKVGSSNMSVRTLLEGALTAGVVLILSLWVSSAIETRLLKGAVGRDLSLRMAVSNLTRAALMFLGLILGLSAVGIDLTALSVLGGAVGVGIGFGLQKLAANYVSGFVVLAERSVRIGDTVRVDNVEGRITEIRTRSTVIRSPAGVESIVPNEVFITSRVDNLSLSDSRLLQVISVGVGYDSDVDLVSQLLQTAALEQPRVLRDPAPAALLNAFGPDALEFTLNYWIADPENGQSVLRSNVNRRILQLFREHGIGIPYPQRVVHVAKM